MEEESQIDSQAEVIQQEGEKQQDHKTLNHNSLYYSFIERYFTTYRTATQYLHRHSNGLFLIRVRTEALPSKIVEIRNVLKIQEVKGKKKRGGTRVNKNTVIAQIVCQNGYVLPVEALVDGVILECNQKLSPEILLKPQGYVAVINPGKKFKADPNIFEPVSLPHQM